MLARRNTKQKNIVYDAVVELVGHVSADEIYAKINKDYPNISKATVYRNLNVLCQEGKLRRIEPINHLSEKKFDSTLKLHSHAICTKCGKMIDVHLRGEEHFESKAKPMEDGFMLTCHELIFEGICSECREKENENGT